ncbi:hypothetical protein BKA56DRAFT_23628 [Ilyonectria sp. MPI-CAGE-AT-0026]|nr:hypothetical protein BKA56DRAFT_23628 [Ilyonectria sp. MPI-CAGE-AT-0026]
MCVAQIPTDKIVTQAATTSGQRQTCVLFHVSLLASCHWKTPGANQRASSSPPSHHGNSERVRNRSIHPNDGTSRPTSVSGNGTVLFRPRDVGTWFVLTIMCQKPAGSGLVPLSPFADP